jgi:hypothetical protein
MGVHPQWIIILGRCCSLHAGSDRRNERNIPKTDKNKETRDTWLAKGRGAKLKAVHQAAQQGNLRNKEISGIPSGETCPVKDTRQARRDKWSLLIVNL